MARWLPVIIGLVVATVLALARLFMRDRKRPMPERQKCPVKRTALLTCALVLSAVAGPAAAKNWVTLDYQLGRGGHWLDRDTLRREGDLVYFEASARLGNRVYPDDRTPGIAQAYNCRTRTLHAVRDGALDRGRTLAGSAAIPYDYVVCR